MTTMIQKKRLDVHIRSDLRDYIEGEHERTGRPRNSITEELIEHTIAYRQGKVIQQQSLPVIREIVSEELRGAAEQIRHNIQDDLKASERREGDRLAALIVRALREGLVTRRMLYAMLARGDQKFAEAAFEDANVKAGRDIASKTCEGAA